VAFGVAAAAGEGTAVGDGVAVGAGVGVAAATVGDGEGDGVSARRQLETRVAARRLNATAEKALISVGPRRQ